MALHLQGITDEEKQHLRQKLGALIDQEDAQVQLSCYLQYSLPPGSLHAGRPLTSCKPGTQLRALHLVPCKWMR